MVHLPLNSLPLGYPINGKRIINLFLWFARSKVCFIKTLEVRRFCASRKRKMKRNEKKLTNTSSSRASEGRKFPKKKEIYSKERICLQNVCQATDQRDAQTICLVWLMKLLPLHGCDVMCFEVICLWFDVLWSDVASCEVFVVCDCDVLSCHVMWCPGMFCQMCHHGICKMMQWHLMWCSGAHFKK